jgi:hypothetical protein
MNLAEDLTIEAQKCRPEDVQLHDGLPGAEHAERKY